MVRLCNFNFVDNHDDCFPFVGRGTAMITCKNCNNEFEEDYKFCPECGTPIELEDTEQVAFNKGSIKCDCGQEFYFETVNTKINCIKCGKEYDVINYSVKKEQEPRIEQETGENNED